MKLSNPALSAKFLIPRVEDFTYQAKITPNKLKYSVILTY